MTKPELRKDCMRWFRETDVAFSAATVDALMALCTRMQGVALEEAATDIDAKFYHAPNLQEHCVKLLLEKSEQLKSQAKERDR